MLVWESTAERITAGSAAGLADAQAAITQARACGLTDPVVVYFACDYDAPETDQPAINAYLDAAAGYLGLDCTGLYGGYWPLSRARTAGKAAFWWGTYAWSGTNWDSCGWTPHIMQQTATVNVGGVTVDVDTVNCADYGQWPRPEVPVSATGPASWDTADWAAIRGFLVQLETAADYRDLEPVTALWWLPYAITGATTPSMNPTQVARIQAAHAAFQSLIPDIPSAAAIAAAVVAALPGGTVDEATVVAGVEQVLSELKLSFPPPAN